MTTLTVPRPRERWLLALLLPLFLLSGTSGLVYQVLWLRLMSLTFGVTTHAASTVLASFMAGLALGSFVAGRLVDRARRPLVWFGVAELLVGLSAFATQPALSLVQQLYVDLHPSLETQPELHGLVRFLLSFAVLVAPTTLMGATLPIVIKSALLRSRGLGASVGLLYGINTTGAILGTLLCGFVLIGEFGIRTSFAIAAAVNLLVGVLAILAGRRFVVDRAVEAATPTTPARARRVVLLVFGISGFASLALEVIWFRMLATMLDTSTYAFTVMLATVLAGIALGSFVVSPFLRRAREWWSILAGIEILIGLAALASLLVLARSYRLAPWIQDRLPEWIGGEHVLMLVLSFVAMFPTCLLLGIAFPIGLRVWSGDDEPATAEAGRRIGTFYAVNLTGAIAGALAAGFLLLPLLGTRVSLAAIATLLVASGFLLLPSVPGRYRSGLLTGLGASWLVIALLLVPDPFAAALRHRHRGETVLWREEGVQTTVAVHQHAGGNKVLYLDGKHQANDHEAMVAQHRWIGDAGMLLHPDPKRALVIGLGGGATSGAIARYPGIEVDVVELSDSVVRAAELHFAHANSGVVTRPNVDVRVDDGRNFLLLNRTRYDLITADIIQPHDAGAGMVYSIEYFRLARAALADGGLMVQWVCGRTESEVKMIVRTFITAFPETTMFGDRNLLLMVGSLQRLRVRQADFERKLADPQWRAILESIGIPSFAALRSKFIATPESVHAFAGQALVLSDDRPLVEYYRSIRSGTAPIDHGILVPLYVDGSEHFAVLPMLRVDVEAVPATRLHTPRLFLAAGREHAGKEFIVVGNGGAAVVEAAPADGLAELRLEHHLTELAAAGPLVERARGWLDAGGHAEVSVPLPEGTTPGSTVRHAVVVFDRETLAVRLVSNTVSLRVTE